MTREALEQAARDAELANGLAAAEQELKESSKSSNAGDGEGEERDVALARQVRDDDVDRRIAATPRSSRSSARSGAKDDGSHHTSGHNSGHASGYKAYEKDTSSSGKSGGNPVFETGAAASSGSHSASSNQQGGVTQALMDLLERLTAAQDARAKADDDLAVLKRVMAETAAQHGVQVQELHKRLHKACKKSSTHESEHATLLQKIASLEAKASTQKQDLEHRLAVSQAMNSVLEKETDEERDRLAGLEARHAHRIQMMKDEFKEELAEQAMVHPRDTMLVEIEAERATSMLNGEASVKQIFDLQEQLDEAWQQGRTVTNEHDQLRTLAATAGKDALAQTAVHLTETSRLQGLLDAANRELLIRGQEDTHAVNSLKVGDSQKSRLKQLEAVIASSRESHTQLTSELSELRLQMLGMERGHEAKVDDMQRMLNEASKRLQQGGTAAQPRPMGSLSGVAEGMRAGAPGRRGNGVLPRKLTRATGAKLTCIDEEDDNASIDGSIAASGNVSSTGGIEVGDLKDFDGEGGDAEDGSPLARISEKQNQENLDLIQHLTKQLTQARAEKAELREDLAGSEAELANKVQRLTELLRVSREGNQSAQQEMATLKESMAGDDATRSAQLDTLRSLLMASETESESKDALYQELVEQVAGKEAQQLLDAEAIKQELFRALEARRIASNRLEDMRLELEATQRRCEQSTAELRQIRDQQSHGSIGDSTGVSSAELEELRERLRNTVEERNVLAHTLEWKEVQWKSKIEHMELEHAELKRRQDQEVAALKKKLDDTVVDFKRKLDAAEQEKAHLAQSMQAAAAAAPQPAAPGPVNWLALLRCPSRQAPEGSHGSGYPTFQGSPMDPAHCREVGWQLLTMVPTVIALLCDVPGLKVLGVSDGAKATWGEALVNSLVVSLLASPTSAAWLRRAIVTHQNLAALEGSPGEVPGFAVHALGQLEFRDASGRPFESSVTVAHLPAEPKLGKAPTVVVVVEPLNKGKKPHHGGDGQSRRAGSAFGTRSAAGHSTAMSVVSDDVLPSDSASNIAARYM